jgi:hypothetical protein
MRAMSNLLLTGLFLLLFHQVKGQPGPLEQTISLPAGRTTVYEALAMISQQTGLLFIYDSKIVDSDRKVRVRSDRQPLHRALDLILTDPGLAYRIVGDHVLIYRMRCDSVSPIIDRTPVAPPGMMQSIVARGRVTDRESGDPIPYAAVGIAGKPIGTITNSDGFFLLRIPDSLATSNLIISHLGFHDKQVPVGLLNGESADLYLDRRIISIQEVIIRYLDPQVIIANAIEHRKLTCPSEPVYLTTFYREGVKKNRKYTAYSEAVLQIYKTPCYSGPNTDQVKLLKSRGLKDPGTPDTVFLKLKAGVQSALSLDIAKNLPGFLDLSAPLEYSYGYSNLVSYHDKDAYAIDFTQNGGLGKALFSGTVFIERDSFAILGAEFELNPDYIHLASEDIVLRKSPRLIVNLKGIRYSIHYQNLGGRYYPQHIRCEMEVSTRLRHHIAGDQFSAFLEMATCAIDTTDVMKFSRQEIMKPGVVFSDQPYIPDDHFWEEYNVITPEANLEKSITEIIRKIGEIR